MTESVNYAQRLLRKLSEKFTGMSFRYGYNYLTEQHIIEVSPKELYFDRAYGEAEGRMMFEFLKKFPQEDIYFTIKDKYTDIGEEICLITSPVTFQEQRKINSAALFISETALVREPVNFSFKRSDVTDVPLGDNSNIYSSPSISLAA